MGDSRAARRELEAAAHLDPGDPRYQVDLAGLLLDQGELAPAVERLRQAVRLEPRSAAVRLLLATALRRAGDYDGMVREYTKVRRLGPTSPPRRNARKALDERRGWLEAGIQELTR